MSTNELEKKFITLTRKLIHEHPLLIKKEDRMNNLIKLYNNIYSFLKQIIKQKHNKYILFIACTYNKCIEFDSQNKNGFYDDIDDEVRRNHFEIYTKTKYFLAVQLKKNKDIYMQPQPGDKAFKIAIIKTAYLYLEKEEMEISKRPKRNIDKVDYSEKSLAKRTRF